MRRTVQHVARPVARVRLGVTECIQEQTPICVAEPRGEGVVLERPHGIAKLLRAGTTRNHISETGQVRVQLTQRDGHGSTRKPV